MLFGDVCDLNEQLPDANRMLFIIATRLAVLRSPLNVGTGTFATHKAPRRVLNIAEIVRGGYKTRIPPRVKVYKTRFTTTR